MALSTIAEVLAGAGKVLHQLSDDAAGDDGDRLAWLAAGVYAMAGELGTAADDWRGKARARFEDLLGLPAKDADAAERRSIRSYQRRGNVS